ncbi:MAG: serine/threonine-protein kinase [Holophaga sp.]|nr:serine/threonine-protein kinase [Holophaga sp.]
MSSEHQARIIGMGLLLGEIPFEGLVTAWEAIRGEGDTPDLEALLSELLQKGILTEASRTALHAQLTELEWLLDDGPRGKETRVITEEPGPSPTAVLSMDEPGKTIEASHRTASGHVDIHTQPWAEVGRRLLSALTLPRWNQFTDLQFVGEGGMGRIFKAFDPTLDRTVALKFLRYESPGSISNLVREARNQAQVDHPNICRVYEVKEWHGLVYVVMQYIEGKTLDQVAPLLDLNEKVELMERVAEAVHAAHRHGLIHRDLKPTNIMVERSPEGAFVPYVLDFGLARDTENISETRDGTIQGTAHYMAPEQARGDTAHIERRTDVYALGVTLYEIFSGAPPFAEIVGMDCLLYILNAEIPPLRTRNAAVSADLQTIVMKCLEKDIARRYESAQALGEDLRRFRVGEPILARPTTLGYRLGKFVLRNKAMVTVGAVALAIVLILATMAIQARLTAANQAQWAQHFGQEAERIEALLRYVRLQPAHDIRGEKATVMQRIKAIELELKGARALVQGPGNYALGRAYLALGDTALAQSHLDLAWSAGFQTREVAYARGRVLGQIYAGALDAARAIQDGRLRQARLQELEETLRTPAAALLRQGQGSLLDPPGFQEALLARYDEQFKESLRLAKTALAEAPWFYEARRLEGEIHLEQARRDQNPAGTLAHLELAGAALEAAITTAPSDPGLWDLLSRRWWEEMVVQRRAGKSIQAAHQKLQEACEKWQRLVPDATDPEARLARGELEAARVTGAHKIANQSGHGKTQTADPLARALVRTQALLAQNPGNPELLGAQASALQMRAYRDYNRGLDPRSDLDRAIDLLRQAFEKDPSAFELFEPFVASHWARVEFEKSQGRDPAISVEAALQAVKILAKRYPKVADFQGYLGGLQVELADFQANHGIDPAIVVQRALAHLDQAVKMAPARFEFHFSRGNAFLAMAQHRVLQRQEAEEFLLAAETAYREAMAKNASTEGAVFGLGEVAILRAQILHRQGRSPLKVLIQIEDDLAVLRRQGETWRLALHDAQASCLRARWAPTSDEVRAHLFKAEKAAERVIALSGRTPSSLLVLAQVQVEWAEQRTAPTARRTRARQLLKELLGKDPALEAARQLLRTLDN